MIKQKIHLLFEEKLEKCEQDINSVKLNLSNVQIAIIPYTMSTQESLIYSSFIQKLAFCVSGRK